MIFCCTFLTKQYWQIEQQEHVAVDLARLKTVTHCCLCSYPPLLRAIQVKISSVAVQTLPNTIYSGPGVRQVSIIRFSELVLEGAWKEEAVRTSCVVCVRTTDRSVHPWHSNMCWTVGSARLTSPTEAEEFHNGAVTKVFCTAHHQFFQLQWFRFRKLRLIYWT